MDDKLLQEIRTTLADARTGHAVPDRAMYVKHVGELVDEMQHLERLAKQSCEWQTLANNLTKDNAQLEAENKELRRELVATETDEM